MVNRSDPSKLNRREFLKSLEAHADGLRTLIDAECDAFDTSKAASADRRIKTTSSYKAFVQTYFPHYSCDLLLVLGRIHLQVLLVLIMKRCDLLLVLGRIHWSGCNNTDQGCCDLLLVLGRIH